MFWKTKKVVEKYTTNIFGKNVTFTNFTELAQILEKASALQDQNRRDYNLLSERQNLILDHLKLKYVPETETKEPAKMVDETLSLGADFGKMYVSCGDAHRLFGTPSSSSPTPPKKKRGRPKKK